MKLFPSGSERTHHRAHPATPNQRRYVLAELVGAGSYMIAMGHTVSGRLERFRLIAAFRALVMRHDALRTRFTINGRDVIASVDADPVCQVVIDTLPGADFAAFRAWALPHVFDAVDPCQAGSLIRLVVADYGTSWRFAIAGHHAITDGVSRGVMNRELLKLYAGEHLPETGSYVDYAQACPTSKAHTLQRDDLLRSLPDPVHLVSGAGRSDAADATGQFVEMSFSDEVKLLRALARSTGTTRFAVLAGSYAMALYGQTGTTSLSTFFQSEGRKALGVSNAIVGPFSNTLPLNLSFDLGTPFQVYLSDLKTRITSGLQLERWPVIDHLKDLGREPAVSLNFFPPAAAIRAGDLEIGPREFLDRRTEHDLNLVWSDDGGCLKARLFYDPAKVGSDRAGAVLHMIRRVLRVAAADPDLTCAEIIGAARHAHTARTGIAHISQVSGRLHDAFFERAQADPDAVAIVTTAGGITRGNLAHRAMVIAGALLQAGVGPGDRVAVMASRGPEAVAALLGVSAAGASFALIDATHPPERIRAMLTVLAPCSVIEADAPVPSVSIAGVRPIEIDGHPDASAPVSGPPRAVAYHLFTSGTTGTPKVISHPEAPLQRFIAWQARQRGERAAPPVTLMLAGLSHDPILRDIYLPLTAGGIIAIPTEAEMREPCTLRALCERAGVTVLHMTPSTGRLLAAGADAAAEAAFRQVSDVFWGGDRLTFDTVELWRALAPAARQVNVYGASETPQAALLYQIPDRTDGISRHQTVPLGWPVPWTGVQLINRDGATVGVGEIGEIVIDLSEPVGGARSADAHGSADGEAATSHRTGDLGYATPDGAVHFLRRQDRQVQLNGFRVELDEIELIARTIAGVKMAAVVPQPVLTLFVVLDTAGQSEEGVRAALSQRLPGYMQPARVVVTDSIPLSPNGKVDHHALSERAQQAEAPQDVAPHSPMGAAETEVATIYARFSGQKAFSANQSLAQLGADSLSMLEIRLELEGRGYALPKMWEGLPIAHIAQVKAVGPPRRSTRERLLAPVGLDMPTLLRCLAILVVVSFHFGYPFSGGASVILFVLSGYMFGTLQVPSILQDQKTGRIWAWIAKLLIPLVPISVLFFAANVIGGGNPNPAAIFFSQNFVHFVSAEMMGVRAQDQQFGWLWFVHVYLQIFVLFGLMLASPRLLDRAAADPWRASVAVLAGAVLMLAAVYQLAATYGADPDPHPVELDTLPFAILPFFALGMVVALADTQARKRVALAAAVGLFVLMKWGFHMHGEWVWLIALFLCMAVPRIKLPKLVGVAVTAVAAHSLMIYLSHHTVDNIFSVLLGGEQAVAWALVCGSVVLGVVLGHAMRPVYRILGVSRLADRRVLYPISGAHSGKDRNEPAG